MKVLVIGSGLIGITTAYFLAQYGHEVSVIDRASGPGQETSFANGALLTPSMAEPWNSPGVWRALLASLGRSDAPVQLCLRVLPQLTTWGVRFLSNSRRGAFERNALHNLRLSLYSLEAMRLLREDTYIEYDRTAQGSLRVFRDRASLDLALRAAQRTESAGLRFRGLSPAEIVDLEPTLEPICRELVGGIHYETDEVGDAYRFCLALEDCARREGVKFYYGQEVSTLEICSGAIGAVICGRERREADRYIVAAGSYSPALLRGCGVHLPVQPVKGYSLSFQRDEGLPPLRVPVVDDRLHAVAVPLGSTIRVAGTAEFAGYDLRPNPERIKNLASLLRAIFPRAEFASSHARPWCGLRSVSADGVPIIGPTKVPNLLINTGHGHLGWTMAVGSAVMLAALISGRPPSLDPGPYLLDRF